MNSPGGSFIFIAPRTTTTEIHSDSESGEDVIEVLSDDTDTMELVAVTLVIYDCFFCS